MFHYTGMKLKPSTCDVYKLHIEYLGHLISGMGIYPLEQKIQTILDLTPPTNVTHSTFWDWQAITGNFSTVQLNCLTNYCIDEKELSICMDSSLSNSIRYYQPCYH